MDEGSRIAMLDWSLDSRGWISVSNRMLNQLGLTPIADAEADEIIARAARRDIGDTIVRLQGELSAVVEARGFALMLDGGGQDAHVHYLAPTEAAARWDCKTIGRRASEFMLFPEPPYSALSRCARRSMRQRRPLSKRSMKITQDVRD